MFNLTNFFTFYNEDNPNHVAAVSILEKSIPHLLKEDSDWVIAYRAGNKKGGPVDLHNFFLHFSERNADHVEAVNILQNDLPAELKVDDGSGSKKDSEWIEKYRSKPPVPSILNVPFYSQIDNYRDAHRTCNSSACAMCLEYFKPGTLKGPKGDDEYVKKVFAIGDTTDHSVQTRVLQGYGITSRFSYNLSFSDLDRELSNGRPIVIGILHRGPLSAPTGGHMVVVIGKTPKGDYVVNDPYGSLNDGYTGPVNTGIRAVYKRSDLVRRWCPNGNDGWGRIFK
jgi:hypothetical protein